MVFHDFFVCTKTCHYQISGLDYQELIDLVINGNEPSTPQPNPFFTDFSCSKCKKPEPDYQLVPSPIPTLEEAFIDTVPVDFSVEIKYPTQDEIDEWQLQTPISVAEYCQRIVDKIPTGRTVVISSFHPEVCSWVKQNTKHTVMFLTDAGEVTSRYDPRLSSLQAAFDFARESNFDGIVANAAGLLKARVDLIANITSQMKLYTYGKENCAVEQVKEQLRRGVSGIITDDLRVLAPLWECSKSDL